MKKIMAVLFVSFIGVACGKSTPKSHLDDQFPIHEHSVIEFCKNNPATEMCIDIGKKDLVKLSRATNGTVELRLYTPQESIEELNKETSRIRIFEIEKWKAGWNITVPDVLNIKVISHSYIVEGIDPETGKIAKNKKMLRRYYNQDGYMVIDWAYIHNGVEHDVDLLQADIRDFNTTTKIYKVVFFGKEIEGDRDIAKATHYYPMPVIHFNRLAF